MYGLGTGAPVLAAAIVVAFGARSIGSFYAALTAFEKWARRVTGLVFIGVGIYVSLRNIFNFF